MLKNIRACLFDMDGTLIDSERIWQEAMKDALEKKGVFLSMDEIVRMEHGRAWNEIFEDIHSRWPGAYPTRLEMEAVTVPFYERAWLERDVSIPGSVELLRRLHGMGYEIAIASGSTRDRIEDTIARLDIGECVKCYVGGGDYARGKPEPDCFFEAARLLEVAPCDCIVFEDAEAGVAAAKAAGMRCVALDGGMGNCLDDADLVVRNLLDILEY